MRKRVEMKCVLFFVVVFLFTKDITAGLESVGEESAPVFDEQCFDGSKINCIAYVESSDVKSRYLVKVLFSDSGVRQGEKIWLNKVIVKENNDYSNQKPGMMVLTECDTLFKIIAESRYKDKLVKLKNQQNNAKCDKYYVVKNFKELIAYLNSRYSGFSHKDNENELRLLVGNTYYFCLPKVYTHNGYAKEFSIQEKLLYIPFKNTTVEKLGRCQNFRNVLISYMLANLGSNNQEIEDLIIDGILILKPKIAIDKFRASAEVFEVLKTIEQLRNCDSLLNVSQVSESFLKWRSKNQFRFVKFLKDIEECNLMLDLILKIVNVDFDLDLMIVDSFKYRIFRNAKDKKILVDLVDNKNPFVGYGSLFAISKSFPELTNNITLNPAVFENNRESIVNALRKNVSGD